MKNIIKHMPVFVICVIITTIVVLLSGNIQIDQGYFTKSHYVKAYFTDTALAKKTINSIRSIPDSVNYKEKYMVIKATTNVIDELKANGFKIENYD